MLKVIRALREVRAFLLMLVLMSASAANGQSTTFTYQGQLSDAGAPANGSYDLRFALFDTVTGGTQIGANQSVPTVPVSNGIFTAQLDFGASVFSGADRYLEIDVRPAGNANPYTVLSPRQPLTSSPYAIQTLNAQQLGGLPPSRFVQSDASGNVGIGIAPRAGIKLDVAGSALITPGGSGTGSGVMQFGTPNAETGMSNIVGTGRADFRFDGTTLKLVAGPVGGPPPSTNGIVITTGGQVGIGTPSPDFSPRIEASARPT